MNTTNADDPWAVDDNEDELNFEDPDLQRLLDAPPVLNQSRLRSTQAHQDFDNNAGATWIYPSNFPQRAYQRNISQAALYRNTLVVLPTGLGKTFIAAVVMYNIYRWYPKGKVIFMAPTRPLVAQQIDACARIMPFPAKDTVELTGKLARAKRAELWRSKRVFFATPQAVHADIADPASTEEFPYAEVKLLVVDEAHKARGRYAYVEVAQAIAQRNRYFRVLALSATPGRNTEDVAMVVRNLFISHIEVRCDNSIDVSPYVHKRSMKTIAVPLGEQIKRVREQLLAIIEPYMRQLQEAGVLSNSAMHSVNRNLLIYEQKRFRELSLHERNAQQSACNSNFAICISLYHALELLERHGLRVFLNSCEADEEGRTKFVMKMDARLRDLVESVRAEVGPNPFDVSAHAMTNGEIAPMPMDLDFGHPKFEKARECLLAHFQAHGDSRAIVFCEYRESVMLIYRLLLQHTPLLRPRCFVGQGGSTGSIRALTQKQQIEIMADFRSAKSNILVATCIGEEGIDVGEVDLIVCFDISTSNPTRFVQRIGRTGRKRNGNVIMLVTEGREQQLLKDVLAQKDQTNKRLHNSSVIRSSLYQHAPRLVPTEIQPQCVHMFIKSPEKVAPPTETVKAKAVKEPKKKTKLSPVKGSQDLRKFFKQAPQVATSTPSRTHLAVEKLIGFERRATSTPGTQTQRCMADSKRRIEDHFKDLTAALQSATNTQLMATQPAPALSLSPVQQSTPVSQPQPLDAKYLKKLNKFLLSRTPIVPYNQRVEELRLQLKSKKFSADSKLFLLRMRPSYVREILEQMQVLEAVDVAEAAAASYAPEEREVREMCALMTQLCGGSRAELQKFLDAAEVEAMQRQAALEVGREDEEEDATNDAYLAQCVERIFDGLETPGQSVDNFAYIQRELKETQRYKRLTARPPAVASPASPAPSTIFDTMSEVPSASFDTMSEEPTLDCTILESKYASQWQNSTPLAFKADSKPTATSTYSRSNHERHTTSLYQLAESPAKVPAELQDEDDELLLLVGATIEEPCTSQQALSGSLGRQSSGAKTPSSFSSGPSLSSASKTGFTVAETLLHELDFDEDPFDPPFAGYDGVRAQVPVITLSLSPSSNGSVKENYNRLPALSNSAALQRRSTKVPQKDEPWYSPDIFETTAFGTTRKAPILGTKIPDNSLQDLLKAPCTPPKASTPLAANRGLPVEFKSPSPRRPIALASPSKQLKSPSIFDLYKESLRNGRGLLSCQQLSQSPLRGVTAAEQTRLHSPAKEDVSAIARPVRYSRRRLLDSEDEFEEDLPPRCHVFVPETRADSETDCAEISASQQPPQLRRRSQKRKRANTFIDAEAGVSGDSEDDMECTGDMEAMASFLGNSSDDELDPSQKKRDVSHMQGVYLQSLKSPVHRRGAFKLPAPRVYDDLADIYSQQLPIEESQYLHDSFVVAEDVAPKSRDVSLSPLSRAELILKQRRREKRQGLGCAVATNSRKRRRLRVLLDEDEDDDD